MWYNRGAWRLSSYAPIPVKYRATQKFVPAAAFAVPTFASCPINYLVKKVQCVGIFDKVGLRSTSGVMVE